MAQSAFRPIKGPILRGPQGPRPVGRRSSISRRTYSSPSSSLNGNGSSDGTRSDQNSSSTSISSHPASRIPSPIGSRHRRSTSGITLRSYKGKQALRGLRVYITLPPNDQDFGTARLSSQKESSTGNATDNRSEDASPFVEHEGRSDCETRRLIGNMRGNVNMFEQTLQDRDRKIDTLEKDWKRLKEWGNRKEQENQELRAQILQLEHQLETSECNRHQTAETSAQLRNRVEELNKDCELLKAEKQNYENRLSSAEEKAHLCEERKILIRNRHEAESISWKASSECYEAQSQSHSLQEELEKAYESIEVLKHDMASLKDQSEKNNTKLIQERSDFCSIMDTHEKEISRLQAEFQMLNDRSQILGTEMFQLKSEFHALSERKETLEIETSQLKSECQTLNEQNEEAKAVIESRQKIENTANGTSREFGFLRNRYRRGVVIIHRPRAHIKEVHIEHRG